MSILDRYERQATILRKTGGAITDYDVRRDIQLIGGEPVDNWKAVQRRIAESGDPTMLSGGYAGAEVTPPPGDLATVTTTGTEAALWPTATWSPIAANPQCPKAYMLYAFGVATTAATQGSNLFQARFGQIVTSPSIGVTPTSIPTASETATPWMIMGRIVIQKGGTATSGLVVANFKYEQGTAVSGGSVVMPAMELMFGTTTGAVSVVTDGSVAAGLWIGSIAVTSTTNTFKPQSVIWMSYN